MYAYMRVLDSAADSDLRQTEHGLRRFADTHGYLLGGIFQEHQAGSLSEFSCLVAELRRTGAQHVVVPSRDHLSSHRLLRDTMIDTLEHRVNAQVWVLA